MTHRHDNLAEICDDPAPEPKDVWFVWTKMGRRPCFAHPSEEVALVEATRLAKRLPGHSFLVMHAVHKVRVAPAPVAEAAA